MDLAFDFPLGSSPVSSTPFTFDIVYGTATERPAKYELRIFPNRKTSRNGNFLREKSCCSVGVKITDGSPAKVGKQIEFDFESGEGIQLEYAHAELTGNAQFSLTKKRDSVNTGRRVRILGKKQQSSFYLVPPKQKMSNVKDKLLLTVRLTNGQVIEHSWILVFGTSRWESAAAEWLDRNVSYLNFNSRNAMDPHVNAIRSILGD